MAVDYQQIYRDLHDIVVAATGLPDESVRPSYPNASAEPAQDRGILCSINLINQTVIGKDTNLYENETGGGTDLDETAKGDRNITASIKVYGGHDGNTSEAQNIIERISLYVTTAAGNEMLNKANLGFLRKGQILDLSSLQNGSFEVRRQIDIEFHIITTIENKVNAIESAEIEWAYYGSKEITGTIEVTQ